MVQINFDWDGKNTKRFEIFEQILEKLGYKLIKLKNETIEYKGDIQETKEWIRNKDDKGRIHLFIAQPKEIKSGNSFRIRVAIYCHSDIDKHQYERYQTPLSDALKELKREMHPFIYVSDKDKSSMHWTIKTTNDSHYDLILTNFKADWQELKIGKYQIIDGINKYTIRFIKQNLYIHITLTHSIIEGKKDLIKEIDEETINNYEKQIKNIIPDCEIFPFHYY